jgi:transposase-like protein
MAGESFAIETVECGYCKTKQRFKVAITPPGGVGPGTQTIRCIKCKNQFVVLVSDKIIGEPFVVVDTLL